MILEALLALALSAAPALAETPEGDEGAEDADPLAPYRLPFDTLVERNIGSATQPIQYNWRRSKVHFGAWGNHPFELNNFNSLSAGGLVRVPTGRLLVEGGVGYTWAWDSPSSELLALTPYRQPGHPRHVQLNVLATLPVAEGVVTVWPKRFPAVQLTFNLHAGLRYYLYPAGFSELDLREVARAVVSPTLTDPERDNLEAVRLDAMMVDSARYGVLLGLGNDIWFRNGFFLSPRALFGLPLLAPVTETEMYFQADFGLAIGVAL